MTGRRVVISGIGAVTPIGVGVEGLWQGLRAERSAVRVVNRFDPTPFKSHLAAQYDLEYRNLLRYLNRVRRLEIKGLGFFAFQDQLQIEREVDILRASFLANNRHTL